MTPIAVLAPKVLTGMEASVSGVIIPSSGTPRQILVDVLLATSYSKISVLGYQSANQDSALTHRQTLVSASQMLIGTALSVFPALTGKPGTLTLIPVCAQLTITGMAILA